MDNVNKILILPYFGEFNEYFQLWLNSCGKNRDIDWLIITDIENIYNIPTNVRILRKSFSEIKELIENKFEFKVTLDTPYKLCDFKQFYGYIFEEYIEEYEFWGYCDCDLIFGDIKTFLSVDLFLKYDKLLRTGHLSFVRNKKEINEIFKKYDTYKITLSSPVIYGYDESVYGYHLGFAGELLENGYKFYCNDKLVADIDFRYFPFHVVTCPERICVFLYDDGKIYKIERCDDKTLRKTEVMYVHLQKRKMEVKCKKDAKQFLIIPNAFLDYDSKLLESDYFWQKVAKEETDYFNYELEKRENRKRDIKRFLHEPHKLDSLIFRLSSRWRNQ